MLNYFNNIIGYENVKLELSQIIDVITNTVKYTQLGVSIPTGLLLHGVPGVGKTLLSNLFQSYCFLKELIYNDTMLKTPARLLTMRTMRDVAIYGANHYNLQN